MFQCKKITLAEGNSYKYVLYNQDDQLSYDNFLTFLQQDEAFLDFFINVLSEISFYAYQWETPPVTSCTIDQPFEFVVTNSPGIDLSPDPGPFLQYFNDLYGDDDVAVFNNLGKDAKLIAPAPLGNGRNYSHIGVFTDEAPKEQQKTLWKKVGEVTTRQISDQPIWLNTTGGGVAWLHVRLDSRPKYYRHHPYCEAP